MKFAELNSTLQNYLNEEMGKAKLPEGFVSTLENGILPLAEHIAEQHKLDTAHSDTAHAPIWGICGAQGTGKSTLVHFLQFILDHRYGISSVGLSLDDFYLSHQQRLQLGKTIHPLLCTRGVPGTHDVSLGIDTLQALQHFTVGNTPVPLPKFNKAEDDCVAEEDWPTLTQPVDIILFEGWCVGTAAQPDTLLDTPCNILEAEEDSDAVWRRFVNEQLKKPYQQWYGLLEQLVFLKVPSFEQVFEWRTLQEQKLRQSYLDKNQPIPAKVMNEKQVERFIHHYERLTRWNLHHLSERADVVLELLPDHSITSFNLAKRH